MDKILTGLQSSEDGDLVYTKWAAFQKDPKPYQYNGEYFDMYKAYEGNAVAGDILQAKTDTIKNWYTGAVLDIGVGSGEFVRYRPWTYGYDINPKAVEWLKENGLYSDNIENFDAVCFWDVIEHIETPVEYFAKIKKGAYVFCSMPVFDDLSAVKKSKHYKPDEHLYYFTHEGFIQWMIAHGFIYCESNTRLTLAGREDILSFVFKKWG